MKRARKLVPRLLAVGVILGMGAISIVQGIHDAPTDQNETNPTETAAPPESTAQRARVLTPVASIGLNDTPPYEDTPSNSTPSNSRFSQGAVDVVDDVASGVVSQFDRARDQTGLPQTTRDGDADRAPLPSQAEYSRFSSAPLPVEIPDDVAAEAQDTVAEYDPPVDTLATDLSDPVGLGGQNEFFTEGTAERTNRPRSDQPSTRSDALPRREPANPTLPPSSIPLATETEEAAPADHTFVPLPVDETRIDDVVAAESTDGGDLPTGPDSASPAGAAAVLPFSVATSPRAEDAGSQRGGQPQYAGVNPTTAPPQDYDGELASTSNQRDLASFPQTEPAAGATDSAGEIPKLAQDPVVDSLGKPGSRILEGLQTPSLTIEKRAPPEIQIGKLAEFRLTVRNVGKVPASNVVIQDEVPEGTRFVGAEPEISATQGSTLYWELDTLAPGDELTVAMQVMPEAEGEIGSVGVVTFQAEASVRTIATRPQLVLEQSVPDRVYIGDVVQVKIRVSNPGNGAATSVVLEEDVPDGLSHPAGSSLERELGTIRPNESREVELTLTADKAGNIEHVVVARADANLVAEDRAQIEVVAPDLQVGVSGPAKRYLERQATYALTVENHGTASARNIELVAHLPKGMKFVETNNAGQYDPRSHAVYWSLEELPADQSGEVQLVTLPIEPGEQKLRFEGHADMGLNDSFEKTILVDGLPSLFFEVADTEDPIEIGKETTYEIRLVNEGSKDATEITLLAELSPGLKPLDANGPERSQVSGQQIAFPPLARLAPGADVYYKIRAEGVAAGHQLIRVQVKSGEMQVAVTDEESSLVYADQ